MESACESWVCFFCVSSRGNDDDDELDLEEDEGDDPVPLLVCVLWAVMLEELRALLRVGPCNTMSSSLIGSTLDPKFSPRLLNSWWLSSASSRSLSCVWTNGVSASNIFCLRGIHTYTCEPMQTYTFHTHTHTHTPHTNKHITAPMSIHTHMHTPTQVYTEI
jgi:hypothetical protein